MSPNQKVARLNLAIAAATLLGYLVAVQLLAWSLDRPWLAVAGPACGVFGLLGLTGLGRLYYRPMSGQPPMVDERDKLIEERSRFIAFNVSWLVWVIGSVGAWALLRYVAGRETIPVDVLPILVVAGFLVFLLTQSLAVLAHYGWSARDDEA
jgi:hypothetical protein